MFGQIGDKDLSMADKLGPTGKFPDGKIHEDDEGEITLGVAFDPKSNCVIVNFGKPISWIGLPPIAAIKFANMILDKAKGH